MTKEFNIIFFTVVLAIIFAVFLISLKPDVEKETIKISEPIPEPVIEEKVYKKYEMGNYR